MMDTRMKVARCISIACVALAGSALALACSSSAVPVHAHQGGQGQAQTYTCWYLDSSGYVAVRDQQASGTCHPQADVGGVTFHHVVEPGNLSAATLACKQSFNDGSVDDVYTTLPSFWEVSATCSALRAADGG